MNTHFEGQVPPLNHDYSACCAQAEKNKAGLFLGAGLSGLGLAILTANPVWIIPSSFALSYGAYRYSKTNPCGPDIPGFSNQSHVINDEDRTNSVY